MGTAVGEEPATQSVGEAPFEELFELYFAQLYDFSIRLARDRELAALVVQESFLAACAEPQDSDAPVPFQRVLFADAHNALARYLRERPARTAADEQFASLNRTEPEPVLTLELAEVAWESAAELRLDDYELLDLSLRRGWDSTEIAAMLKTQPNVVERRLAGVRADFEQGFSALLLLSRRRSCLELDFLVSDETRAQKLRRRISRHLTVCQTCQETRFHHPAGSDALSALALVPAPPGWQDAILSRLQEALRSGPANATMIAPAGPLASAAEQGSNEARATTSPSVKLAADRLSGRPPKAALLGGGLIVLALLVGGMCATRAFQSGSGAPTNHSAAGATAAASATAPATAAATAMLPTPTLKRPTAPPPTVPPKKKKKP